MNKHGKEQKMNIPVQAQTFKKTMESAFSDIRKEYNLTMNEILVLLYLIKNNKQDTATDIVEDIMICKSHISKSVALLENKKIIIRMQDNSDKKVMHIQIVDRNSELINKIQEKSKEIDKKITEGIPKENLVILEESFKIIKENIKKLCNCY